ncbi:MAG: exodeoxyribonuclease VII large subunit [Methanoculleus sp. SDB]|nr:MAG: exodeoxyribonuclease VII large subunit [Methanoculleus sp. SDB]
MDWFTAGASPAPAGGIQRVSEISGLIERLLDDSRLQEIWIEGEVRDLRFTPRGHLYFSLSEQKNGTTYTINCVMWQSSARELPFTPENGMHSLAWGSIQVYKPHGRYQFIVRDLRAAGTGEKHLLVEQWRTMLTREGVFDPALKKTLPRFPKTIGVVMSASGAARHDIEQVIGRRFPVEIILSPASVQGDTAPQEIVAALSRIDGTVDVIIVGRGGGSFEDLFAFNHPDVVRAIAACRTPVVSAVGHETDVTLCDFAADVRAPTPSAAAELVVPDRREIHAEIVRMRQRMQAGLGVKTERERQILEEARLRLTPRRFRRRLDTGMQSLAETAERLHRGICRSIERERLRLGHARARMEAGNPYRPLERGYALVTKDGLPVTRSGHLHAGDCVDIRMADGSSRARILEVNHDREV